MVGREGLGLLGSFVPGIHCMGGSEQCRDKPCPNPGAASSMDGRLGHSRNGNGLA